MDNYLERVAYLKYDSCVRRKKKTKNFVRQPRNLKAISRFVAIAVSRLNANVFDQMIALYVIYYLSSKSRTLSKYLLFCHLWDSQLFCKMIDITDKVSFSLFLMNVNTAELIMKKKDCCWNFNVCNNSSFHSCIYSSFFLWLSVEKMILWMILYDFTETLFYINSLR